MSAGPIFREQADLVEPLNPDLTPTAFRRFVEVPPFPVLPEAVAEHIGWWRGGYVVLVGADTLAALDALTATVVHTGVFRYRQFDLQRGLPDLEPLREAPTGEVIRAPKVMSLSTGRVWTLDGGRYLPDDGIGDPVRLGSRGRLLDPDPDAEPGRTLFPLWTHHRPAPDRILSKKAAERLAQTLAHLPNKELYS